MEGMSQGLKRFLNSFHCPIVMLTAPQFHYQLQWSTASPVWGAAWSLRPTGSPPWLTRIFFLSSVTAHFCHPLSQRVPIRCLRSSESTKLDRTPPSAWHHPYFRCPPPIAEIAARTGTRNLMAIAPKSLVIGNGKYEPLVSSLPWSLFKAPWR